jgi:hypothetical protein
VLEPTVARESAFVSGWAIDGVGLPLGLPVVWVDGVWWRVMAVRRDPRPDVMNAFKLSSELDLGFRIYAFETADRFPSGTSPLAPASSVLSAPTLGAVAGVEEQRWRPMLGAFRQTQFEANLLDGPGWRGHIERGEWQRTAQIALPKTLDGAPIVEIETSLPSDPIVIWADGVVDWGERATGNRVRFSREQHGAARQLTVIVPSHVRTHVTAS